MNASTEFHVDLISNCVENVRKPRTNERADKAIYSLALSNSVGKLN